MTNEMLLSDSVNCLDIASPRQVYVHAVMMNVI